MVAAIWIMLPALDGGMHGEDVGHLWLVQHTPFRWGSINLYEFVRNRDVAAQRAYGMLPWVTPDDYQIAFWRPLSSLTHQIDYRLWPSRLRFMHAESIAWYGLLVLALGLLYRQSFSSHLLASLAALAYAMDQDHARAVVWLANRNAIMATALGVTALWLHHRSVARSSQVSLWSSAAVLSMALLAGEFAIATVGYLLAYSMCVDRRPFRTRAACAAPSVLVCLVWMATYKLLGYGVRGATCYVDPMAAPGAFVRALLSRAPVLLTAQFSAARADWWMFAPPDGQWPLDATCTIGLSTVMALILPTLRRDSISRFWFLGMLFALVPVCIPWPGDRLLLFTGVGAIPLVVRATAHWTARLPWKPARHAAWGVALWFLYAMAAPYQMRDRLGGMRPPVPDVLPVVNLFGLPRAGDHYVFLNGRSAWDIAQFSWLGFVNHVPALAHGLCPTQSPGMLHRVDQRTLEVRSAWGLFIPTPADVYRDAQHPMHPGDRVHLAEIDVEVLEVLPDGRPLAARFTFDGSLDEPRYKIIEWKRGEYRPFALPPSGADAIFGG